MKRRSFQRKSADGRSGAYGLWLVGARARAISNSCRGPCSTRQRSQTQVIPSIISIEYNIFECETMGVLQPLASHPGRSWPASLQSQASQANKTIRHQNPRGKTRIHGGEGGSAFIIGTHDVVQACLPSMHVLYCPEVIQRGVSSIPPQVTSLTVSRHKVLLHDATGQGPAVVLSVLSHDGGLVNEARYVPRAFAAVALCTLFALGIFPRQGPWQRDEAPGPEHQKSWQKPGARKMPIRRCTHSCIPLSLIAALPATPGTTVNICLRCLLMHCYIPGLWTCDSDLSLR